MKKALRDLSTWLITLACIFVQTSVYAQQQPAPSSNVHHLSILKNDGINLSDNYILDTVEDEFGFIWFASSNGLIRYDGYSSSIYYNADNKDNSLPSSVVRKLLIDNENKIYVGTLEGFALYERESDSFKRIPVQDSGKKIDVVDITQTESGDILVLAPDNIFLLDKNSNTLGAINDNIRYPQNMFSIFDEAQRIWIGTYNNGGFIYDKASKQIFSLQGQNPWSFNLQGEVLREIKIIDGKYWIGTDKGLAYYKDGLDELPQVFTTDSPIFTIARQNEKLVAISYKEIMELENVDGHGFTITARSVFEAGGLFSLFIDSNDTYWVGTDSGIKFKTTRRDMLPIIGAKLSSNEVTSATDEQLLTRDIWGIDEDSQGNIWSASQSAQILKYNLTSKKLTQYDVFENTKLWDLVVDGKDNIWVAAGIAGVYHIDFSDTEPTYTKVNDQPIYSIHFYDDRIWFIDDQNRLAFIDALNPNNEIQLVSEFSDMINPRLVSIDSRQRMWISGHQKTVVFDLTRQAVLPIPSYFDELKALVGVYEIDNQLWLLTHDADMLNASVNNLSVIERYAVDKQGFKAYSGLPDTMGIWVADNASIKLFDTNKKKWVHEITPARLQNNVLYEGVAIKTSQDTFVFGGKYGFNVFNSKQFMYELENKVQTKPPLINEFRLNTQKMPFTDIRSPLSKPIYLEDSVSLNYSDKRFSFGFALTNPQSPLEVEYRYKLNGYDQQWLNNTDFLGRNAIFYNLPWGTYTLEVQAREPRKEWSVSQKIAVIISPPPWYSKPAIAFYIIFALLLCLFFIKQYTHRSNTQKRILESEERLKLTLWSSGDELWDWDIALGQIHRANTWGTIDFPQDDIRTNSAYQGNIHHADIANVKLALDEHLAGKSEYYQVSYRIQTFKKQWVWVLDRGKVVARDHNGEALRMTGTLKDIQYLKESEEQFRLFERSIENISEGVFITDTSFKFVSVNAAYCQFTGETEERALASYLYFHQYPAAFTDEVRKSLSQKHNWSGEIESKRVNGESYEIELNIDAVLNPEGNVSHYVGVFSDISVRKATEKELLKLSNADPLTELPNRSFFQASQQNLVRKGEAHTLLCLDMDNFKKINDSLGHQTGDILIKQIAKRLQRLIGNTATCYRLGGDEFSILIEEDSDIHRIAHYAQSVLDNLAKPFVINRQEFVLGASLGIAQFPSDGVTPQELLKNADTAMYFAKNSGGNSYKFFSAEMNQAAVRQLQIENLIRQGLKDDLFTVFYQPKVDIASGRLVSMEALVRFEHPQKGLVNPNQFIPLAEQSGQIVEIGERVLEKALQDTKRWIDAGLFTGRVAVNISAKQFEQSDLDEKIDRMLRKIGLSSQHLECEITEGTLMVNPDEGLAMMQRLRSKGIHLALDDFGTGYSSLAYLKRFPLNTLKIDKAFIDDITHSNEDRHMAAAIINIAHNLGLNVVAEGVEQEAQLDILKRYDCEMLQGYLYSKPLRSDKFEKLLVENLNLKQFLNASYDSL